MNILRNYEDAEECVADAFLKAWNSIPPERPRAFSSFIGRIVRNLSINRYNTRNAQKRGGDNITVLISELESCVASNFNIDEAVDVNELAQTIENFLSALKQEDHIYFVRRYWHSDSIAEIAKKFCVGESKVKMSLLRTRKKLKIYLEKRGVIV
jgi:RNA polymerase sigma-70 factor (ECF subfamily)